jgi:hypothetical protein
MQENGRVLIVRILHVSVIWHCPEVCVNGKSGKSITLTSQTNGNTNTTDAKEKGKVDLSRKYSLPEGVFNDEFLKQLHTE